MHKSHNLWIAVLFILITGTFSCRSNEVDYTKITHDTDLYRSSVNKLTKIIVNDIFGPTVASRIYAYPAIAAYEAVRFETPGNNRTLVGKLNGLASLPSPEKQKKYDFAVAALVAYTGVAKQLIFSSDSMQKFQDSLVQAFQNAAVPEEVLRNSEDFGNAIKDAVLKWAAKDNYLKTRSYPKYSLTSDPGKWQPTPPGYMDGNEPNWKFIRPFAIDSCSQFKIKSPTAFSKDSTSDFYHLARQVYLTSNHLTRDQTDIANFWDCNPFALNVNGHTMFAKKKISPGGHWESINLIASKKAHFSSARLCFSQAILSIAIFDGFLCCWDEKYRSQLIRPETYINRYIDNEWRPLLQTPPFPEYPSGHSVISTAAAEVLTKLYGDNFSFTDNTEKRFGLPTRSYPSFDSASKEAAISRLYGGIHYIPAIEKGRAQGAQVGDFIIKKLKI